MLQHHPYKSYRDIKSYVATRMVQHWENSVATQEDPCRDPSTQSQPQTLSGREAKNLCLDREGLCRDPNHQACLGTMSRHGDPCRNTKPEKFVSHAPSRTRMPVAHAQAGSCAWLKNPVATLKTLSLHRARETLPRHKFLCRDREPKMGSSPLWSSCTSNFPFFFPFNTP